MEAPGHHASPGAIIWNVVFYCVAGMWMVYLAIILTDLFPRFFANPMVGFLAIGALGLLVTRRTAENEKSKRTEVGRKDNLKA